MPKWPSMPKWHTVSFCRRAKVTLRAKVTHRVVLSLCQIDTPYNFDAVPKWPSVPKWRTVSIWQSCHFVAVPFWPAPILLTLLYLFLISLFSCTITYLQNLKLYTTQTRKIFVMVLNTYRVLFYKYLGNDIFKTFQQKVSFINNTLYIQLHLFLKSSNNFGYILCSFF